jgi:hypothetical protein
MPRVIVSDANETLLEVGALEPHFKQAPAAGEGHRIAGTISRRTTTPRTSQKFAVAAR